MAYLRYPISRMKRTERIYLTLMLCMFFMQELLATHNRAGEKSPMNTSSGLTYRIRVTTYTKQSAFADRPSMKIRWGDEAPGTEEEQLDSLDRVVQELNVGTDVKRNVYMSASIRTAAVGTFVTLCGRPEPECGVY
jgi:hypothetical protein